MLSTLLHSGDGIVEGGKVKGASFRYRYREKPRFEALPDKPYRFRVLSFDKKTGYNMEDITDVELTNYAVFKEATSI